jgi:hypothetical protein
MSVQMKLVAIAALALIGLPATAFGDGSDGTIEMLEGGNLSSTFHMSLGFLYGAGSRPDGLGAPVSTVRGGLASISGNPAGLVYVPSTAVVLDVLPPFGIMASDFVDLDGVAADAFDEAARNFAAPGVDPTYPTVATELGQRGGVISGAVGFRTGRIVWGAAIEEPVSAAIELTDTGIEAFGQAAKEVGAELIDIQVSCTADAAADFAFNIRKTTVAAATEVRPNIAVGASVSRYSARAELSANVHGDGIVSYGDKEYAFNDPDDPWDNDLGMTSSGSYEGGGFGWNLGASWRPLEWLMVDASYTALPALTLNGSLTTVTHAIPGITDGELEVDSILESQPTLTEREKSVESDPLTLHFPSNAGLAVSCRAPFVLATLEYRVYSGSFGFEYQDSSEGVEVRSGVGVELDFGGVRIGGGVLSATMMGDSIEAGAAGENVLIPMANLGLGIAIGENMRVDTTVLAVPLQVFRLSLGYEF